MKVKCDWCGKLVKRDHARSIFAEIVCDGCYDNVLEVKSDV